MPITLLRELNRSRIFAALLDGDAGMRTELAQHLGLSAMAITRIVRELSDVGLVAEADHKVRAEPGRRPTELVIEPAGAYVLGFELHAYRCSVVLLDLARRPVARRPIALTSPLDADVSLAEMARAAKALIKTAHASPARVLGAGIAVMGMVDRARGTLIDPTYLGWPPMDVVAPLSTRLSMPVVVDRVANAVVAASVRQSVGRLRNLLLVNVGFVLSAGLLVDGQIVHGDNLQAGNIGHLPLPNEPRQCVCGQRGCLNVVASGWAALTDIGVLHTQLSPEALRAGRPQLADLLQREADADSDACNALHNAGCKLGLALRSLHIALDPGRILLSGPVGRTASYVAGVREGIGSRAASLVEASTVPVDEAAALLAFDEFIRSPRLDLRRLRTATGC